MTWLLTAILISLANLMPTVTVDFRNVRATMNETFYPLLVDRHRYLVLDGGAGSGKSVFAAQKCVYRAVVERNHRIPVIRKVAKTIRESCFEECKKAISRWKLTKLFEINKSDLTITCPGTNSKLIFVGMDDPEKIKSIHDITSVWIEEATELMPEDLRQIGLRLRGQNKSYHQIIVSFNPILATHWLKGRFFDTDQHELTQIHKSTFRDNRFLTQNYLDELNDLQTRDPEAYEVYGKGEWGRKLSGLVYGSDIVVQRNQYPDPHQIDETTYGLDFGYNNPSALLQLDYYDRVVWVTEKLYASGLTTDDLIARMDRMEISKSAPIYADSAEPDRIEMICRAGYNCKPMDKRPGSVAAGISIVKATIIKSLPSNYNFNAEWNTYAWKRDKYGVILDEPEKNNDHAMDALRGALYTHSMSAVPEPDIFVL